MKNSLLLLVCMLLYASCQKNVPVTADTCIVIPAKRYLSQNEVIAAWRDDVVEGLAVGSVPNALGAMGRNKNAYFHVRFQMGIAPMADWAIDSKRTDVLESAVKAIEYAFQYQTPNGDFQVVVPVHLAASGTPLDSDLASGVAFFASSLGTALLAFQESAWFRQQTAYQTRIENLQPSYRLLLQFLKSRQAVLQQIDAQAPNRLLYNAVAFYSLGVFLNDEAAQAIGIDFARQALAEQDSSGYFREGGGWDTSYQGVALSVGFRLLGLMPQNHPFYETLYRALACGTHWQSTRVKPDGEISTEGNTRVYAGGEKFLGEEKQMSWTTTLTALLSLHAYTEDTRYAALADRVIRFYR